MTSADESFDAERAALELRFYAATGALDASSYAADLLVRTDTKELLLLAEFVDTGKLGSEELIESAQKERTKEKKKRAKDAAKLVALQARVSELKESLEQKKSELAALQKSQKELQIRLQSEEKAVANFRTELGEAIEAKKSAEKKLDDAEKDLERGKKDTETSKEQLDQLERQLAEARDTASKAFKSQEAAEKEKQLAENQLQKQKAQLEKAQQELASVRAEVSETKSQVASLRAQLSVKEAQIGTANEAASAASTRAEIADKRADAAQKRVDDLEASIRRPSGVPGEADTTRGDLQTARKELQTARATLAQAEADASEARAERDRATATAAKLTQELGQLRQSEAAAVQEAESVTARLQEVSADISAKDAEIARLDKLVKTAGANFAAKQTENTELKTRLQTAENERNAAISRATQAQQTTQEALQKSSRAASQLKEARARLSDARKLAEASERELVSAKARLEATIADNKKLRLTVDVMLREKDAAKTTIDELTKGKQDAEQRADKLQRDMRARKRAETARERRKKKAADTATGTTEDDDDDDDDTGGGVLDRLRGTGAFLPAERALDGADGDGTLAKILRAAKGHPSRLTPLAPTLARVECAHLAPSLAAGFERRAALQLRLVDADTAFVRVDYGARTSAALGLLYDASGDDGAAGDAVLLELSFDRGVDPLVDIDGRPLPRAPRAVGVTLNGTTLATVTFNNDGGPSEDADRLLLRTTRVMVAANFATQLLCFVSALRIARAAYLSLYAYTVPPQAEGTQLPKNLDSQLRNAAVEQYQAVFSEHLSGFASLVSVLPTEKEEFGEFFEREGPRAETRLEELFGSITGERLLRDSALVFAAGDTLARIAENAPLSAPGVARERARQAKAWTEDIKRDVEIVKAAGPLPAPSDDEAELVRANTTFVTARRAAEAAADVPAPLLPLKPAEVDLQTEARKQFENVLRVYAQFAAKRMSAILAQCAAANKQAAALKRELDASVGARETNLTTLYVLALADPRVPSVGDSPLERDAAEQLGFVASEALRCLRERAASGNGAATLADYAWRRISQTLLELFARRELWLQDDAVSLRAAVRAAAPVRANELVSALLTATGVAVTIAESIDRLLERASGAWDDVIVKLTTDVAGMNLDGGGPDRQTADALEVFKRRAETLRGDTATARTAAGFQANVVLQTAPTRTQAVRLESALEALLVKAGAVSNQDAETDFSGDDYRAVYIAALVPLEVALAKTRALLELYNGTDRDAVRRAAALADQSLRERVSRATEEREAARLQDALLRTDLQELVDKALEDYRSAEMDGAQEATARAIDTFNADIGVLGRVSVSDATLKSWRQRVAGLAASQAGQVSTQLARNRAAEFADEKAAQSELQLARYLDLAHRRLVAALVARNADDDAVAQALEAKRKNVRDTVDDAQRRLGIAAIDELLAIVDLFAIGSLGFVTGDDAANEARDKYSQLLRELRDKEDFDGFVPFPEQSVLDSVAADLSNDALSVRLTEYDAAQEGYFRTVARVAVPVYTVERGGPLLRKTELRPGAADELARSIDEYIEDFAGADLLQPQARQVYMLQADIGTKASNLSFMIKQRGASAREIVNQALDLRKLITGYFATPALFDVTTDNAEGLRTLQGNHAAIVAFENALYDWLKNQVATKLDGLDEPPPRRRQIGDGTVIDELLGDLDELLDGNGDIGALIGAAALSLRPLAIGDALLDARETRLSDINGLAQRLQEEIDQEDDKEVDELLELQRAVDTIQSAASAVRTAARVLRGFQTQKRSEKGAAAPAPLLADDPEADVYVNLGASALGAARSLSIQLVRAQSLQLGPDKTLVLPATGQIVDLVTRTQAALRTVLAGLRADELESAHATDAGVRATELKELEKVATRADKSVADALGRIRSNIDKAQKTADETRISIDELERIKTEATELLSGVVTDDSVALGVDETLSSLTEQLRKRTAEVKELNKAIGELKKQTDTAQATLAEVRETQSTIESTKTDVEREKNNLNARLPDLKIEIAAVAGQTRLIAEEVDRAAKPVFAEKRRIDDVVNRIRGLVSYKGRSAAIVDLTSELNFVRMLLLNAVDQLRLSGPPGDDGGNGGGCGDGGDSMQDDGSDVAGLSGVIQNQKKLKIAATQSKDALQLIAQVARLQAQPDLFDVFIPRESFVTWYSTYKNLLDSFNDELGKLYDDYEPPTLPEWGEEFVYKGSANAFVAMLAENYISMAIESATTLLLEFRNKNVQQKIWANVIQRTIIAKGSFTIVNTTVQRLPDESESGLLQRVKDTLDNSGATVGSLSEASSADVANLLFQFRDLSYRVQRYRLMSQLPSILIETGARILSTVLTFGSLYRIPFGVNVKQLKLQGQATISDFPRAMARPDAQQDGYSRIGGTTRNQLLLEGVPPSYQPLEQVVVNANNTITNVRIVDLPEEDDTVSGKIDDINDVD